MIILSSCKSINYEKEYSNLKNKPKDVTVINYDAIYTNDSVYKKIKSGSSYYKFDKKGRIISNIDYDSKGEKQNAGTSYLYNNRGRLIDVSYYLLDSTLQVSLKNI